MSSHVIFWPTPPLPLKWWRHLWTAPKGKEISQSLDINILLIIGEIIFTFFEFFSVHLLRAAGTVCGCEPVGNGGNPSDLRYCFVLMQPARSTTREKIFKWIGLNRPPDSIDLTFCFVLCPAAQYGIGIRIWQICLWPGTHTDRFSVVVGEIFKWIA